MKLSKATETIIKEVEDLLEDYEPSHPYFYKRLGRLAQKSDADVPYSSPSFTAYRIKLEGALARARATGRVGKTIKSAQRTLTSLTRGRLSDRIKRETMFIAETWKSAVFDEVGNHADQELKAILIQYGLWDDPEFWRKFLSSNYFHPIYQHYKDKQVSADLHKRDALGHHSYWGERLMDFTAKYVGVNKTRFKGQKPLSTSNLHRKMENKLK